MAQIFPINILPQSSFVEYQPTATKGTDVSSILNTALTFKKMEEEKRRADEEQRRYEFERRIKTTDQIIKFNENLDNLSLNAENPWQKSVMEEVNNAVDPIRKEIDYEFTTDNPNYQNIYNSMFKLSNSMRSNPKLKEALAQGLRYKNIEKQASQLKDLDEDAWNDFQVKYFSYSGENGELDPTLGFNIGSLRAFDIDKFNSRMKTYIGMGEDGVANINGEVMKGTWLKDISGNLAAEWNKNKRHLRNIYDSFESFSNSVIGEYKKGAVDMGNGNYFRPEGYASGKTTVTENASTDNIDSSLKSLKGDPRLLYQFPKEKGITITPSGGLNVASVSDDGLIGLTQQDVKNDLINPSNYLENIESQKKELNAELNRIGLEQAELLKNKEKGNRTSSVKRTYRGFPLTDEGKEWEKRYNELAGRAREIYAEIGELDKSLLKKDVEDFYMSDDYKKANEDLNTSGESSWIAKSNADNLFKTRFSAYISASNFKAKTLKEKKDALREYQKKLKNQEEIKHVDNYIDVLNSYEQKWFDKYSNTRGFEGAKGVNSGYILNMEDNDTKNILSIYLNEDTETSIRSSTGHATLSSGAKYKGEAGERLNVKNISFDPTTGTYSLNAVAGKPKEKDNGEPLRNPNGSYVFENNPKNIKISDENINREVISYNMLDMQFALPDARFNGNVPEATGFAVQIFKNIANKTQGKVGAKTSMSFGDTKYTIENLKDNRYKLTTSSGESVEVNGNYELAKLIYRKYKVDSYNKANETNNKTNSTQGGGATSVGKSQTSTSDVSFNNFKDFTANIETTGVSKEKSYNEVGLNAKSLDLGRYQINTKSNGKTIIEFMNQAQDLVQNGYDLSSINSRYKDDYHRFENLLKSKGQDFGANNALLYQFLHSPKAQEKLMDKLEESYKPFVEKTKAAYAAKGIQMNDYQAMWAIHHHGVEGASGLAKGFNERELKEMGLSGSGSGQQKDYSAYISKSLNKQNNSVSTKNISKTMLDDMKILLGNAGLLDPSKHEFSSGYRPGDDGRHGSGQAVDILVPIGGRTFKKEQEFVMAIAKLTSDPESSYNKLMTNYNKENPSGGIVYATIRGTTYAMQYHGKSGHNHLHIEVSQKYAR